MPPKATLSTDPYRVRDQLHIRLLTMRLLEIDSASWTYETVRTNFWRIYYNNSAGASIWFQGTEIQIVPGCAFIVPAWVEMNSRCNRVVEHMYLHFDVVGFSGEIVRQWFDRPIALPTDTLTAGLAAQLSMALRVGPHDNVATIFMAKALIDLSLARIFQPLEKDHERSGGSRNTLVHRLAELTPVLPAMRRIDDNPTEPASNTELADRCGMSEDYFIRVFRQCVGQTPARYSLERRITFAAEALIFTDQSLKAIAANTGFTNRFHFTRVFTRIIGIPPAQYRLRGTI